MNDDAYFAEVAGVLAAAGVPSAQIEATVEDLRAHLAETGTSPAEEFGPAAGFAARLGGRAPEPDGPDEAAEHWTWTTDIFNDRRMLAVHGAQGWEVESLDPLGRFVCRRTPGTALRWEYRREVIAGRRRARIEDELTPEGWELCGEWLVYGYFKRPAAATAGPAGAVAAPPAAPRQWLFLSRRGKAALAAWVLLTAGATVAFFAGGLGAPGFALAIALTSSLLGVWTASLEPSTGHDRRAAAK
ncbi:hypothetical protein HHL19_06430 [Streptomyces sp. R302]|uniref:hypothetical protein n=1 Tax=unclassified Streptomyces TaxID=2593676 RepID=UPI00145D893C|nr:MULTISPECIES: hypothetical protein [unclassified Streptomyces]NML53354.1 hypothetical protein [Streptomyces sp. R301]NML78308.1 hypothetical protein [Streptomyces sp. R302]